MAMLACRTEVLSAATANRALDVLPVLRRTLVHLVVMGTKPCPRSKGAVCTFCSSIAMVRWRQSQPWHRPACRAPRVQHEQPRLQPASRAVWLAVRLTRLLNFLGPSAIMVHHKGQEAASACGSVSSTSFKTRRSACNVSHHLPSL